MSLDILKLQKLTNKCSRNEPVYCENACPFSFDVKNFLNKMQNNKIDAAYKFYKNTVLFPQIISSICDAPCISECIRKNFGGSIDIKRIEKACCVNAKNRANREYYIPKKNKEVIIIGGGLSGMGCAMKLSRRGYSVKLFEKETRLGGGLWEQLTEDFTAEILEDELQFLFDQENLEIFTESEINSIEDLKFDAAFIATGRTGNVFGLKHAFGKNSLASDHNGVFFALYKEKDNPAEALRTGILAANEIEVFLKIGHMEPQNEIYEKKLSGLKIDLDKVTIHRPSVKDQNKAFTIEEAVEESRRCLFCGCSTCVENCEMLSKYKKYPEKVIEDINATLNVMEGYTVRIASRQINSCNLCGSCVPKCPSDFDFEDLFLESRRQMHRAGDIPPAYHDFWIRDMEHALADRSHAVLMRKNNCNHLFFPGCQLGASDPEYVARSYDYLNKYLDNVGVMLSCCGAPAYWAGDQEKFESVIDDIKRIWINTGKPEIILACPHCGKMFQKYFSECSLKFIYEIIGNHGFEPAVPGGKIYTIFDPCASRNFRNMQDSIRKIVHLCGFNTEELEKNGENAQCCGYGGHIHEVDRDLLDNIVRNRIESSPNDYITYCTNCRDIFVSEGKRACHILDLLLLSDGESLDSKMTRKVPHLSQRRKNREEAKHNMELRFGIDKKTENRKMNLFIDDSLMDKMNRALILEEDAQDVIESCEKNNYKLLNKNTGNYIGHLQRRFMTYWVEYRKEEDGFRLINIYCHRMKIQEECDDGIEDR